LKLLANDKINLINSTNALKVNAAIELQDVTQYRLAEYNFNHKYLKVR